MLTFPDMLKILGGSTLLTAVLLYLGVPLVVERLKNSLSKELESFRQELGFARSTYDKHLELLLSYYNRLYQQYYVWQNAAVYDRKRSPDGTETSTKQTYLDKLGEFKRDWDAQEGKIRLLLPKRLLDLHITLLAQLNEMTDAVTDYSEEDDSTKKGVEAAFKSVHETLMQLESGLRDFLRTERLLA